jgi:hypothetical protein
MNNYILVQRSNVIIIRTGPHSFRGFYLESFVRAALKTNAIFDFCLFLIHRISPKISGIEKATPESGLIPALAG